MIGCTCLYLFSQRGGGKCPILCAQFPPQPQHTRPSVNKIAYNLSLIHQVSSPGNLKPYCNQQRGRSSYASWNLHPLEFGFFVARLDLVRMRKLPRGGERGSVFGKRGVGTTE
jgi:hypothetical protein